MANYTVSQDIDDFMKSADDSAARTQLGLGSAATSSTGDFATSDQGDKADSALQSSDIGVTVQERSSILDNTTASFTTAEENKLSAITGTNTGDQDLSGLQPILTEGAFVDGDKTKLDGVTGTNTGDQDLSGLQVKPAEGAFVDGDKTKLDSITGTNTGDQDLSALATKANVLELDNTTAFTPTADNQPATKKYVDDNAGGGGAVDSVNTQVGVVVLDADDISDATTTNKFATQAELDKANSAVQSGDNVSTLTNDAGYLTTAPAAPVDSVNTQVGVVVLDADDISDATTTNKFTTQAEADKLAAITGTNTGDQDLSGLQPILAEGAFVDGDKTALDNLTTPTLDSVTTNGATTTNSLTVGSQFATGNNIVSNTNCTAIGGTNNNATGPSCEVIGGDGSTASGTASSVFGGSNHNNAGNYSATLGGVTQVVAVGANRSAIIGGSSHTMNHADSVIIGGSSITSDASNTVFLPNLNVKNGFKMPTGATNAYVLTSDANGVGTWQAAGGGGGGSSIVASHVDNLLVISKPTSSNVVLSITGLQHQMEIGKTYYVKMFFNHEGGQMSGGATDEFIILDHTPWSTTAGVERGFAGMNWAEPVSGNNGAVFGGKTFSEDTLYHVGASTSIATWGGFQPYKGFVSIEGFITAPSTANFTPTLTYTGAGTGSITGSFQGMIMEMP